MILVAKLFIVWLLYSVFCTILIFIFDNDTLIQILAIGPFGWCLVGIQTLWRKINRYFKQSYKKMSIWDDGKGNLFRAKPEIYLDIRHCALSKDYKLIKRYAKKSEWKDLPMFSNDFLRVCLTNCDRCIHRKECDAREEHEKQILCKTDDFGCITEYNQYTFNPKSVRKW